jgi:hypothetical protein
MFFNIFFMKANRISYIKIMKIGQHKDELKSVVPRELQTNLQKCKLILEQSRKLDFDLKLLGLFV